MKVYVDENDYVITYCAMTGRESLETLKSPIIVESLADYTKQVRNEVCEKIRTFAYDTFKEFGCFDETDLEHILDQLQGE